MKVSIWYQALMVKKSVETSKELHPLKVMLTDRISGSSACCLPWDPWGEMGGQHPGTTLWTQRDQHRQIPIGLQGAESVRQAAEVWAQLN